MNEYEKLEKELADIKRRLEELKSKKSSGKRERLDSYLCIIDNGDVVELKDRDRATDIYRHSIGNYFSDLGDGRRWRNWQLARQRIVDFIRERNAEEGWEADWNENTQVNFCIGRETCGKFGVSGMLILQFTSQQILPKEFYGSYDTIKALREQLGDDCKTFLAGWE